MPEGQELDLSRNALGATKQISLEGMDARIQILVQIEVDTSQESIVLERGNLVAVQSGEAARSWVRTVARGQTLVVSPSTFTLT